MAQHRRYLVNPQERIAYSGGNTRADSRGFGPPYSPRFQGDVAAGQNVRDHIAREGVAPLEEIINGLDAHNLPPQLLQGSFVKKIAAFGYAGAIELIPKNPRRRYSFLVSNFTGANLVMFSYDRPTPIDEGRAAGVPLGGGCFEETNGSVSVNGIWVFCNDPNETYPIWILGYEGGISNVGNKL